ncbi:response regulator transcription factor [Arcobacter aquimarinus]|uniref:Two-component system response regulator n=1 Tax=Arcobacter aquimarinus TaxID=1315211 RepID=A0AAE7E2B2_9BACT|nr:response regulator transcription factor [Arcobacter aquimarinus]MCB9097685.1 response regulator transcription factor [Arcobacter sp.]QKE27054.1 two-component system response regulator [Arcobacter aquimarinus]RXI36882.1 transcriptional regulator [Arcobacter aquimarinus]
MQNFKTKVLLVEDEELARKTLTFYLNTVFDEVVTACDGAEALEIIKESFSKKENFDLIISDLNMPNLNGMQMIDEILKLLPNQRFIIVSAHKNEEDLLKLINLRVSGYFVKPLNIDNMMEMLQKAKEEVILDKEMKENTPQKLLKLNNSYTYDLQTNKLYNNKIIVKLSKKESEVLEVLITNIGELISLDRFKQEIWNNVDINDSSFRTVMKRLKDKIKDDDFILSQKGYGYIIEKVLDK